ncbi:MAG TPA: GntR family transcriptional regulator [Ferrovibrio sp.]|jgi:DNA-binding GntR family transcriptional regulator|uniref:GntR family transcriptional regulator n=1 Tax=Ferrovibrio sp. TaxID=1917215 RepID=UPI002ED6944B
MRHLSLHPGLAQQAYDAILDAICSGQLAPGSRIIQEDLAARLAVSRQPVTQALLLLRKQGFLRETGRRSLIVAPLDAEEVRRVYAVRGVLDGLAARCAAETNAQRAAAEGPELIAAGRKAVSDGAMQAMIAADIAFHRFLYELSGNPLIEESASLHWQHIRRAMGGVLRRGDRPARVWDEHAAILAAVAAGACDEAERLSRRHAGQAATELAAQLQAAAQTQTEEADDRTPTGGNRHEVESAADRRVS